MRLNRSYTQDTDTGLELVDRCDFDFFSEHRLALIRPQTTRTREAFFLAEASNRRA